MLRQKTYFFLTPASLLLIFILSVYANADELRCGPGQPYSSIQAAIDDADACDVIIVEPGTYLENIDFLGKAIIVRSTDPCDPCVVAATIIDGGEPNDPNNASVVTFRSGEGNNSILTGFTIANGTGSWLIISWEFKGPLWNRCGGGVVCYNMSEPTINDNIFRDNIAGQGGGVYVYGNPVDPDEPSNPPIHLAPIIQNNIFRDNNAVVDHGFAPPDTNYPHSDHGDGGAIVGFQGVDAIITGNEIRNNHADSYGGGLHLRQWSDGLIEDNHIHTNNSLLGAGVHVTYNASPVICDNIIQNNSCTGGGGGIYIYSRSNPIVERNLITQNSSNYSVGIGVYYESNPVICSNFIVKNNGSGIDIAGCSAPLIIANNTVSDNYGSGIVCGSDSNPVIEHNIVTGNGSGCGNCYGIYLYPNSFPAIRYNNVWGNEVDGFGPELSDQIGINGNVGVPPSFVNPNNYNYHLNYDSKCINTGDPNFTGYTPIDYDGESRKMGQFIDIGADETWPVWNITTSLRYLTIQTSIDDADSNDKIIVTPGQYPENICFNGKILSLTSVDPDDWDIVEKTIIDGNQSGSVVTFFDHEDPNAILAGFTIIGGMANSYGGGINVGNGAAPTIRRNIIRGNVSGVKGGGIYYWSNQVGLSVLEDNIVFHNSTGREGGGIHCDSGTSVLMLNNVIMDNYASGWGGGVMIFDKKGAPSNILTGNLIVGNGCGDYSYGGGVCVWGVSVATIVNNTIVGNKATYGGGIYALDYCEHLIANNLLTDNLIGCGMYGLGDPAGSQVISHNNNVYQNSPANYCEGEGWADINGNISIDPDFVDSGYWNDAGTPSDPNDDIYIHGNYHLLPDSPCVDAGDTNSVPAALVWDMDHEERIFGDSVDIGVDEVITNLSDLNTDGIVDFRDLAVLVDEWLSESDNLHSDLYKDNFIDLKDFVLLTDDWLWTGGWHN